MLSAFIISFFLGTLKPLTNALHMFRGRSTLKDVFERFRNGSSYHDTHETAYEMLLNYMRSMIYTNELTHEVTNENSSQNGFANHCECHKSDIQMPNSLSEIDEQTRNAMLKSKLAENNILTSTRTSEFPYKKVNMTISFIVIVSTILINSIVFRNSCLLVGLLIILFILSTVILINIFRIVCKTIDEAIANTFNDCNIFEKAEQLSLLVQVEESTNYPRSRFEQFIYFEGVKRCRLKLVDREPSRIPVKQLARAFGKSRKIREAVRKYIRKNVPKSSRIHVCITKGVISRLKELYTIYARKRKVRKRIDAPTRKNGHTRWRNTVVTKTRNHPKRPKTTQNDPQPSTTIHNDPQRPKTNPKRSTTTHNNTVFKAKFKRSLKNIKTLADKRRQLLNSFHAASFSRGRKSSRLG